MAAFATSYIKTVAATVTRNADAASMTGANFSSWFNNVEGTLYIENQGALLSGATYISANITDGTTEIASIRNFGNSARFSAQGVSSASAGSTTSGVFYKASYAFKTGDQAMSVNGAAALTGTTTITSVPTILRICQNSTATQAFTTHMRKLAYYPSRLADAQLQALTTV